MLRTIKILLSFFLLSILLSAAGIPGAFAQSFNNEWINYNNTYYKFKIGKDGLVRIPQTTLQASGLAGFPVENLRLFRNGIEVPFYSTSASGLLPANGYIEFWGQANDGEPDNVLYRRPENQHVKKHSLHSDTAVYFLTYDNAVSGKRYLNVNNNVAGNTLPAEPYFMHTLGNYFREQINLGVAAPLDQYVYSSSYDIGEFWSSWDIAQRATRTINHTNLQVEPTGPAATIRYGAFGNSPIERRVRLAVNNTVLEEAAMNFFTDRVSTVNLPVSLLASGNASVAFTNVQPPRPPSGADPYRDRFVLSFYEITYPRRFNFGGASTFYFEVQGNPAGNYIEITNFSAGSTVPVLYDLETLERYEANIDDPTRLRFRLNGSNAKRKLVLCSTAPASITQVNSLQEKKFLDISNPGQQGNYLIISNPRLFNGSSGNNPVEDYRAYRNSPAGGGYNARVYDINELTDQFAFGIKGHPLAIKNFIRYARERFPGGISNVFLIGRGVNYLEYRYIDWNTGIYYTQPQLDELNMVPTYGFPGSDNMLSSASSTSPLAVTNIGRLSVINGKEIEDYLEKVKEYESAQQNNAHTIKDRLWMKNVLHVTGASESLLATALCNYMNSFRNQIADTLTGSNVTVLCKNVAVGQDQGSVNKVRSLFEEGMSLLTYFGHSSATTLEFNIEDPSAYNNPGKYPIFSVNGCSAGDFFKYNPQRFSFLETLSERFTLAKQRGGIAFIASTHLGIVYYLNIYLNAFYDRIGKSDYGATLGELTKDALAGLIASTGPLEFLARTHAEQITLHGDPALKFNHQEKPDYIVEAPLLNINPAFISIAEQKFKVDLRYHNMGKASSDSIKVEVKRFFPDGSSVTLFSGKRKAVKYVDSLSFEIPIVPTRDKGANRILVTLDGDNLINEMDEGNNIVSKEFFIYEDEARPAFPYNYSIVNKPTQKLYVSTANPFSSMKQYVMEIDTTSLFNSPLKKQVVVSSIGGVIEFDPQVSFLDSTVYYWRTSVVPPDGGFYKWNVFSFLYKSNEQSGFNQSHTLQHTASELANISIDSVSGAWQYGTTPNDLYVTNGVFPTAANQAADFSVVYNGNTDIISVCGISNIIFNVFDPKSFKPWFNALAGQPSKFGSDPVCGNERAYNFQFNILDQNKRRRIVEFMDLIPDGHYVVVRNTSGTNPASNSYPPTWQRDTTVLGSGNSMYHRLLQQGFTAVDSFNRPRAFLFIYRKNRQNEFQPVFTFSEGVFDKINLAAECLTIDTAAFIKSPEFGPAKAWKRLKWDGRSLESPSTDQPRVFVIGRDGAGNETVLKTIDPIDRDVDVSDINANQFPYLRLQMRNADSINLSPFQLDYWRLVYDPAPEGALAPNLFFTTKDTVEMGEPVNFGIAFKNISNYAFDSIKVKVVLTDKDNVPHVLPVSLTKPLVSGDTVMFRYTIDSRSFPGLNTLYIDFNPDNHQPEQYHFNNFLFRNLYVKADNKNPLLDVTFDGIHILNRDIVSAKPHIQVKLKDESKFMLLKDTSLLSVKVKFPDNTVRTYRFDNDTVRFTPATNGADNTATIDFYPAFTTTFNEETGVDNYELIVQGKDASNNQSGTVAYNVEFSVVNKPMISNLLNYPNPFTTSTAFVFTITGSEVPTNFKIQILTVTGKIVREITSDELGPLHIGRNITEFKWDGTDQYGQRLANGVYLYRVITGLNGKRLEKFEDGSGTDKFFNKGYGKMYLMR